MKKYSLDHQSTVWQQPLILNLKDQADAYRLKQLQDDNQIQQVADKIDRSLLELYKIDNPKQVESLDQDQYRQYIAQIGDVSGYGNWVYYSWSKSLVHFPPKSDLRKLLTARNRNLITQEEQARLLDATIMVCGLSVGANVVSSLLLQGIGGTYILIDNDSLDPTNLNRIPASFHQVGWSKIDIVAATISQVDPYRQQIHISEGLTEENLVGILDSHRPDMIVDEMDQLKMKLSIRYQAQQRGLPLVMATDDGDDVLLDVERYDLDPKLPILHGQIPQDVIDTILSEKKLDRATAGLLIGKYFVGMENVPPRMRESLQEVGKSLPSWPQLGGAASLAGILVSYAIKQILLQHPLDSGRFLIGPGVHMGPRSEVKIKESYAD